MTLRYIIPAHDYNPESGGNIFLHELAYALQDLGQPAYFWPMTEFERESFFVKLRRFFRKPSVLWNSQAERNRKNFKQAPGRSLPLARKSEIDSDAIVVYPEGTLGNPLKARNVVRWLLYKPGLLAPYKFGSDDMFFRVGEITDLPEITGGAPDLFLWKLNPVYRNENRPDRDGVCYIVRKGDYKDRIPQTEGAICIDGLSHQKVAEIFNRCKTFYSYDEATFYSQYAAICGCDSIVIPGLYSGREEWATEHLPARYGVAYGIDDLVHARETRHLVAELLQAQEEAGLNSVRNFIMLTHRRFS